MRRKLGSLWASGHRQLVTLALSALVTVMVGGCSQPLGLSSSGNPALNPPTAGSPTPTARPSGTAARFASNPSIVSGLDVLPGGKWAVKVTAGACTVDGKPLTVASDVLLSESAPEPIPIYAEKLTLSSSGSTEHPGRLSKAYVDGVLLQGALDPASVKVWDAPGDPRHELRSGVDYLLDSANAELFRSPHSVVAADSPVYVDYSVRPMRLDTVEVRPDASVVLRKGVPALTGVTPGKADADSLAIATVFLDRGVSRIDRSAILPIGAPIPPVSVAERRSQVAMVSQTRKKLESNSPVTIVFWGDAVTAGKAASALSFSFPDRVVTWLREQFKDAKINLVRSAVPGEGIKQRLSRIDSDVLAHHPDLVVIQFMTCRPGDVSTLKKDITSAVRQIKASGADVILVTPHLETAMGAAQTDRRIARAMEDVARSEKVGLANVEQRWEHLPMEGIPVEAYLADGSYLPDDHGQEIYAKTVTAFF